MTATERLRELLDERGVEYASSASGRSVYIGHNTTVFANYSEDTLDVSMRNLTPQQAIEVTLGRGTCRDACSRFNAWVCSECGATVLLMFDDYGEPSYSVDGVADVPHYCPNCGRRVVAGDGE